MNRRIVPALLAASFLPLTGCNSIVLKRSLLEGDLAFAPPAVVPDSTPAGSWHLQGALRLADEDLSTDSTNAWKEGPTAGYVQIQRVFGPHVRLLGGAGGYPGSLSGWAGPVFSVRNRHVRWDFETLAGMTWMRHDLEGSVHRGYDDGSSSDSIPLRSTGSGVKGWGQIAMRVRAPRSGPWAELRFIPMIRVGTLEDRTPSTNTAEDLDVSQSAGSFGGGWLVEFERGQILTAGVRFTSVEEAETSVPHFLVVLQTPLGR